MCILKEVAQWREELAQRADVPRGRIMKDEAIAEIASHPPTTKEALGKMRNMNHGFAESDRGQEVLDAVQRGMDMDVEDGPKREMRAHMPHGLGPTIELLRVLLKMKCEDGEVAPKLLARAEDLEQIAAFGEDADVPALKGWRLKLFGEEALALRDGKVALAVEGGRLKVVATK